VGVVAGEHRFVDRSGELSFLGSWSSSFRYTPLYLYGPEGCGKTRLLKEFIRMAPGLLEGRSVAVYVDALERHSLDKAILAPKGVRLAARVLEEIVRAYGGPVGAALAEAIPSILEKAVTGASLRGSLVLVVVDDVVRAIGLERVEWYVKWLFELASRVHEEQGARAVNFIVTTSEGKSLDLVARHRHSHIRLLWNLDKDGFRELYSQLKPPPGLDYDEVWMSLGGNPGRLIELSAQYSWNLKAWLGDLEARLRRVASRVAGEGLRGELKTLVEDPDAALDGPSKEMLRVTDILVEENLILYKAYKPLAGEIKPDRELGIGHYYAWQIPAYKTILEKLIK